MHRRSLATLVLPLVMLGLAACGGTTPEPPPGPPGGAGKAIQVAAGSAHSLALIEDGTVVAWGSNFNGSLGDGTNLDRSTPVQTEGLDDVVAVAAGSSHSLAVTSSGEVWAWGDNSVGQLGVATPDSSNVPVKVAVTNATDVIAGGDTSFAIDTNGAVWAWGSNNDGELGDGSTTAHTTPATIAALSAVEIVQLAASPYAVLALDADGHVWAWGNRTSYVLGTGDWEGDQLTPVMVTNLDGFDISQLAMGNAHALALLADGTLLGWGGNQQGQLGQTPSAPATVHVPTVLSNAGLSSLLGVAGGNNLSLAVTDTGAVLSWGSNVYGQLGDAAGTGNRYVPTVLNDGAGAPITDVVAVAASRSNGHVLALRADGSVLSWGANAYGQLGDDSNTDRDRPVEVAGLG